MPKMCMQYFSADELTTGVKKHATTTQFFLKLRTCLSSLLLSLGVRAMSNYATYTHCSVTCAPCSHVHVHVCTRCIVSFHTISMAV